MAKKDKATSIALATVQNNTPANVAPVSEFDSIFDTVANKVGRQTSIRYGGAMHIQHIADCMAKVKQAPSLAQLAELRRADKINTTIERTCQIVGKLGGSKGHMAWLCGYENLKQAEEDKAEFQRRFVESMKAASKLVASVK